MYCYCEAESIQRRVADLIKSGVSEAEAKKQAIQEMEEKMDGKAPDLRTYIQKYSEIAIPKADLKKSDKYMPSSEGKLSNLKVRDANLCYAIRPYGMNLTGLTGKKRESDFIFYFISSQGDLKWVFINFRDIGELRQRFTMDSSSGDVEKFIHSKLVDIGFKMLPLDPWNVLAFKVKAYQNEKAAAEKEEKQAEQFDF